MHWSQVWEGRDAFSRLTRGALTPLSWLYAAGWQAYLATYRLGLKKAQAPHFPVLCIGNLQVGGTGKSPVTLLVSEILRQAGHNVVVSSSGYGSPRSEGASVAPEGELDAKEWGDEPAMLRTLSPELPLIVGRSRVQGARLCQERFPDALLLLDDGFQHLPLRKHVTIVLDPPTGNRRCLPAGPYREPYKNRSRADLVIPDRFRASFRLTGFLDTKGTEHAVQEANVLCALGDPSRFLRDLKQAGAEVRQSTLLPDHDPMDRGNLLDSLSPDLPLVVTAKDWVKLRSRGDLGKYQVLIARQEACIEPEAEFRAWLTKRLDELQTERSAR